MTPCSALSGTRRFGGTYRLHLQGCRILSEAASKHIPEEDTLQNHRCENLKSYIEYSSFPFSSAQTRNGPLRPVPSPKVGSTVSALVIQHLSFLSVHNILQSLEASCCPFSVSNLFPFVVYPTTLLVSTLYIVGW
jgi:hypothetical protein